MIRNNQTVGWTARMATVVAATLALSGASCHEGERTEPEPDGLPAEPGGLPAELSDADNPPDADALLPPLPGFRVDDDVEAGEIQASLDHGEIPYIEVRRRLLLDSEGFALGDIMVLTFQPGTDGVERFLRHWFGDAAREPVDVAGVEMARIAAEPHDAIVWAGPHFVVVFGRGQAMTHGPLEEVARTTVEAIT